MFLLVCNVYTVEKNVIAKKEVLNVHVRNALNKKSSRQLH